MNTGEEVAAKLDYCDIEPSFLFDEFEMYKPLAGGKVIPKVYWFGWESEYREMVFQILGPSTENFFSYCGRGFSLKKVLMLTDQIIV